jgi:hypothetical protein
MLEIGETTATAYTCNGEPGPDVRWVEVTDNAVQAAPNTAYLVNNHHEQVVLTLPSAPAVGSVVRISGLGRGGWKIAQQAGQYVVTAGLSGGDITGRFVSRHGAANWSAMACSADCNVILAGADGGQIRKSSDGGVTWTIEGPDQNWTGFAASATGEVLFAATNNGPIYRGSDTTALWDAVGPVGQWRSIATSSDGNNVVAVAIVGQIYTSTDRGNTWTPRATQRTWVSVASSADGTKLIAADRGGQLHTSVDSGITWTARESNRIWWEVASSEDGMKLVATDHVGSGSGTGRVYTSADGGETWTAREPAPGILWTDVASSADGTRIFVAGRSGVPHISLDSGASWQPSTGPSGIYWTATGAADGSRYVIGAPAAPLLVSTPRHVPTTTVGVGGSITGGRHHAIELQYAGDGKFVVLNQTGTFVVR